MNHSDNKSILQVNPINSFGGQALIPSSKPETQRALLAASLATGVSVLHNDLRCLETETMKEACRRIGAIIYERAHSLEVHGIGGRIKPQHTVIDALGSGLVFRVFAALACFTPTPIMVTGDEILCGRVMNPLFNALDALGASIRYINNPGYAPIINHGGGLKGGRCTVPGNVSSQFITAILFAAPLAASPTEVVIEGEILSISYIKQTIDMLSRANIRVETAHDYSSITVYPGEYQPFVYRVSGDYTSSSYLIAAASIFPGTTVLGNMNSTSLQGERAIIEVVRTLGIDVLFDDSQNTMTIINNNRELRGDYEFDASDYPNIVPTLAVLGAFVQGTFRVTGGSITRHHKSPRIKAIIAELSKLKVDIKPLLKDGAYDGFEIHGRSCYTGGLTLSSWGDHRIFMSLFVASLRCKQSNKLDGYLDVRCSFPDFFMEFASLGSRCEEVIDLEQYVA